MERACGSLTNLYDPVHGEEQHAEGDVTQQRAAHATIHAACTTQVVLHGIAD